jgi:hypothetical protein
MDKFLDDWLSNIVVNAVFYLLERPKRTAAAILGAWFAIRELRRMFARTDRPSGDLTPATIGKLSGTSVSTSLAVAHLTGNRAPVAPPNIPYSSWHRDSDATHHHAVQEVLRFERSKWAPLLASSENLGSPRVLLDHPPSM